MKKVTMFSGNPKSIFVNCRYMLVLKLPSKSEHVNEFLALELPLLPFKELKQAPEKMRLTDIIQKMIYLALLLLGLYWVYQGDSVNQYISGKTNFAEFSEPISELPTMFTYIYYTRNTTYQFWDDYNISFGISEEWMEDLTPLAFGDNTIVGVPFGLNLEEVYEGVLPSQSFKITPINFKPDMPVSIYALKYTFKNCSEPVKISMLFLAENNSVQINWKFYDGDTKPSALTLGEGQGIDIFPEKSVFLRNSDPCRNRPYNEILLEKTVELVQRDCTRPCTPAYYGKKLNSLTQNLPKCFTKEDQKCFAIALKEAHGNITIKACTRLQYNVVQSYMFEESPNQARFNMDMELMTTVKQEYLICDGMGIISFIGGVLGICVGTSIYTISGVMIGFSELLMKWRKNQHL